ncbi:hypothetical protein, partial [Streptomyces lonegramiae]
MAERRGLEMPPDLQGAGMPKLAAAQNVVHNDSRVGGIASWHDEAPVRASGFGSKPDVEPLDRRQPDGRSLRGALQCSPVSEGRSSRGDCNRFMARWPG